MTGPAVPAIFSRDVGQSLLPPGTRVLAGLISLGCVALLVVASRVPPNPDGVGTHRGLGLNECQFLERSGVPCPSCGMTTSFAWFVRGNIVASLYVQPMGTVLALLACATFWVALYVALTGRPVHRLIRYVPGKYLLMPLLTFAVAAWAWKIFIHLHGIDGWK